MLQILGLVGLPADIKVWRNVVIPAIVAAVPGFFAFAQDASWWAVVLITLGTFAGLFVVSIPAERAISRLKKRAPEEQSTDTSEYTPTTGTLTEDSRNVRERGTLNIGYERGSHRKRVDDYEAEDNVNLRDWPPERGERPEKPIERDNKEDEQERNED